MARLGNVIDDIDDRLTRREVHGYVMQGGLFTGRLSGNKWVG
jgi:hypothetical protein